VCLNCLLPPTQEAFYRHWPQFTTCCLTRTHVK
jgi:hypothetical protein